MQRRVASAARRARQRMRAITPSAAATVAHAKSRCMTPISIVFSRRVACSKSAASAGASLHRTLHRRASARLRNLAALPAYPGSGRFAHCHRPPMATSNPCPGRNRVLGGMFQPGPRAWARRGDDDHGVETARDDGSGASRGVGRPGARGRGGDPAGGGAHAATPQLHRRRGLLLAPRRGGLGPRQGEHSPRRGRLLYTGDSANLEVQVGPGAFVRAGAGTELGVESLESDLQKFRLTAGHAAVDVRRLPQGRAIEVDTPNGAFTIDRPGYYRIDVEQDRTTFTTRRGGEATLVPASGEATEVGPDKQVVLEGSDTPQLTTNGAPDPDEWDGWNLDRSGHEREPSPSARYVSPEVTGAEDLDRNGDWRETPRYGHVWVPHDVPPDWAPYSTGRWIFDPYYGWTWVDDAPWGWAPYHYGRWVYGDGFWGWAPGPVVVAPWHAPALGSIVGRPGVGVSVGVGFPFVSWVALGFGEPVIPWWGPVGFAGRCWWGGWGGPRIVNNVVIQHNTYVNVRNVTVFQNTHVHNAVIAVNRDHFGRGQVEHVRLAAADVQRLRPIHGHLGVKPTPASL